MGVSPLSPPSGLLVRGCLLCTSPPTALRACAGAFRAGRGDTPSELWGCTVRALSGQQ